MSPLGRIRRFYRLPFWERALLYLGCLFVGFLLVGLVSFLNPRLGPAAGGAFDIVVGLAFLVAFYRWSIRHFLVQASVIASPGRSRSLPRACPLRLIWRAVRHSSSWKVRAIGMVNLPAAASWTNSGSTSAR